MNLFNITALRHAGRECQGFRVVREKGCGDYLFLHFLSSVYMLLDGKAYEAEPNACILFKPQYAHEFCAVDEPLVHNWVHFMPKDLEFLLQMELPLNTLFYPRNTSFITQIVNSIEIDFINRPPLWNIHIDGQMLCLFSLVSRETLQSCNPLSMYMRESKRKFEGIRMDIHTSPGIGWDIAKMAQQAGMSRSRFSVLYKDFFGVSPNEDLIQIRLERAKYLLSTTDMKVNSIAFDVGYDSVEYFTRQFKARTGMTPVEYRNGATFGNAMP